MIIFGCSQNQKSLSRDLIKTTNLIKGIQNTTADGITERAIVKTKDILNSNREARVL